MRSTPVHHQQERLFLGINDLAVGLVWPGAARSGAVAKATRSAALSGESSPPIRPDWTRARAPLMVDISSTIAVGQAVNLPCLAHLRPHIEGVVASQAVGAKADVDPALPQILERKRGRD